VTYWGWAKSERRGEPCSVTGLGKSARKITLVQPGPFPTVCPGEVYWLNREPVTPKMEDELSPPASGAYLQHSVMLLISPRCILKDEKKRIHRGLSTALQNAVDKPLMPSYVTSVIHYSKDLVIFMMGLSSRCSIEVSVTFDYKNKFYHNLWFCVSQLFSQLCSLTLPYSVALLCGSAPCGSTWHRCLRFYVFSSWPEQSVTLAPRLVGAGALGMWPHWTTDRTPLPGKFGLWSSGATPPSARANQSRCERYNCGRPKKKFKFKSFKKLFGKKKRKEPLPSISSSGLKQSQSASDVTVPETLPADYDSEEELEATAGVLGSRAVSHDSIFIPEIAQETVRPIRVFSQENVSDHIKALQLKLQASIKVGPPPIGFLSKRSDDAGTSSEDDGLPRSPPEMLLIHEAFSDIHRHHHSALSLGGTGSEEDEQISSETSSRPLSPDENELREAHKKYHEKRESINLSPSVDFSTPPQYSVFLDNSAARHRLSIKPRNQRLSTSRRPSVAVQEESYENNFTSVDEEDVLTPTQNFQSLELLDSRRSQFQNSLFENPMNYQDQPLSDKENNKQQGNGDKKLEKSHIEATQRKFSVSSAWERPRTGSFSLKANVENEAHKTTKLSVLKPGMSKTEIMKEEPKVAATNSENKSISRKTESLSNPEGAPVDKAVFGAMTPNQRTMQAANELPVVTESQPGSEDKKSFTVKIRSTSLSLRYGDGINPLSSMVKRHSAEFKQTKNADFSFCKGELNPEKPEHKDEVFSSKSENEKCVSETEGTQAKPPLPKKPVLQNITVADNNTNKEASEHDSSQEKKIKSPETKIEKKVPNRRLSLNKTTEVGFLPLMFSLFAVIRQAGSDTGSVIDTVLDNSESIITLVLILAELVSYSNREGLMSSCQIPLDLL
ncbi:unnamed protein product, partial [Ranitomeya imitator]